MKIYFLRSMCRNVQFCYHVLLYIFRGAYRFLKLLLVVYWFQKRNITVAKAFAKTVQKYRSKTCLLFEDTSWSFQDLEDYSNKVGNYFLDLGYKVLHILGICAIWFCNPWHCVSKCTFVCSYLARRLCCVVHGKPSRICWPVVRVVKSWNCSCINQY